MPEIAKPTEQSDNSEPSLRDLVRQMSHDSSGLIRDERRLARVEMTQKARAVGAGAGATALAESSSCSADDELRTASMSARTHGKPPSPVSTDHSSKGAQS